MEESKKEKNKKIFIIIILMVLGLTLLGIGIINQSIFKKEEKETSKNDEQEIYTIKLYECNSGGLSSETVNACQKVKYEIETDTEDAKILNWYNLNDELDTETLYILYRDKDLKVYNVKTKESSIIKGADASYNGKHTLIVNKNQDDYIGVLYQPGSSYMGMIEEKSKYYDIKDQKYIEDKILSVSSSFGLLLRNNGLKIYDFNERTLQDVPLEDKYDTYTLNVYNFQPVGISYKGEEHGYYNLLRKEKMYVNKYEYILAIDENYLSASTTVGDGGMCMRHEYLLSAQTEKVVLQNLELDCSALSVRRYQDKYFLSKSNGHLYPSHNYYTEDNKVIYENSEYNSSTFDNFGNLYIIDNDALMKYDINGNLIATDKSYEKLLGTLYYGYVVYLENNMLKVKNLDDNTVFEITEWNDNYDYAKKYSLVINDDELFLAIYYKDKYNASYDEVTGIEFYYNMKTKTYETRDATSGIFNYQALD